MSIPIVLHIADSNSMGCGATVRFATGEPCTVSIARSGAIVKKSRIGFLGAVLYKEDNAFKNAETAMALACLFPERRFPDGIHSPILKRLTQLRHLGLKRAITRSFRSTSNWSGFS